MTTTLARTIALARLILWIERLGRVAFEPLIVAAMFAALALLGLFEGLPPILTTAMFLGALALTLWRARLVVNALKLPTIPEAEARLEAWSNLPHRPLAALGDRLGLGDDGLWRAYRARLAAQVAGLKLGPPRFDTAVLDPRALRALAALGLIAGLVVAGPNAGHRLREAVSLRLFASGPPPVFEVWITPPSAVLRPAIFLSRLKAEEKIPPVPEGSVVTVKMKGARRVELELDKDKVLQRGVREESLEANLALAKSGTLLVRADGDVVARYGLQVWAKSAPKLVWAAEPGPSRRASLSLAYWAYDRYGMSNLALTLIRAGPMGEEREDITLPVPSVVLDPEMAEAKAERPPNLVFRDLTAHPWAGLDVVVRLHGANLEGLEGESAPKVVTLPERNFRHPVARQIVAERKLLARDPAYGPRVARALGALLAKPQTFDADIGVYLALRAAARRLVEADGKVADGIFDLLWQAALKIEEGALSASAKALRDAQEKLDQALADKRPQNEIDALMNEVQQALSDYIQNMAEQRAKAPQRQGQQSGRVVTERDLAAMMDKARELARQGNREAAREMLSMLQALMENLTGAQGQGEGEDPTQQAGADALSKLGEVMAKQQRLMDQTLRESQKGPRGNAPGGVKREDMDPALSGEQKALRKELNDLVQNLGEAMDLPDALGEADAAMRRAENALSAKRPQDASPDQGEALQKLREGAHALSQALIERMAKNGQNQQGAQGRVDPMGRPEPSNSSDDGGSVKVPDEADIVRAREILDELRKRAAERGRARDELEYIERLLNQF